MHKATGMPALKRNGRSFLWAEGSQNEKEEKKSEKSEKRVLTILWGRAIMYKLAREVSTKRTGTEP